MKLSQAHLRRAEEALSFDPRQQRRRLLDRTAVAVADAPTLRRRIAQALGEGADAAQLAIDRLIGTTDQLNVSYLERGMIAADAVARLEVRNAESEVIGWATGFMISPRLLLTNHHVLRTAADAAPSRASFRYEFDALGRPIEACVFALEPSEFFFTDAVIDVTVVAVAAETLDRRQRVARFGWLRLSMSGDTVLPGEWVTLVHHPGGSPKQIALRQNLLIDCWNDDLWYATETAAGSSGAPVFNDSWQVVAMHRGGVPARDGSGAILTVDGEAWTESSDESRIVWRAGVATRTCVVLQRLVERHPDHPLVAELTAGSDCDAAEAIVVPLGAGAGSEAPSTPAAAAVQHPVRTGATAAANGSGSHADGEPSTDFRSDAVTVTVPLRITVRASNGSGRLPALGVDLGS